MKLSWRWFALVALAICRISAADPALKNIEIQEAFKDEQGRTIIVLMQKPLTGRNPEFVGTNRAFVCQDGSCHQLKLKTFNQRDATSLIFSFEDAKGLGVFLANTQLGKYTLQCSKGHEAKLSRLSGTDREKLESEIRDQKIKLQGITDVRKPVALLKRPGKRGDADLYFYIDQSKYGEKPNYRFFRGKAGDLVDLDISAVDALTNRMEISVHGNGKMVIPKQVTPDAQITWNGQTLEAVDPAKTDISKLGVPGFGESGDLVTPCSEKSEAKGKTVEDPEASA